MFDNSLVNISVDIDFNETATQLLKFAEYDDHIMMECYDGHEIGTYKIGEVECPFYYNHEYTVGEGKRNSNSN